MKRVLLVFDRLEDHVRERLFNLFDADQEVDCDNERFGGKAQGRFGESPETHPDFVIAGMPLACDPKSKVAEQGGLHLFERLHGTTSAKLALVVQDPSPDIRDRIRRIRPRVEEIAYDNLEGAVRNLISNHRTHRKYLDVWVAANHSPEWDYELSGVGFKYFESGTLRLNRIPDGWEFTSARLSRQSRQWLKEFKHLGDQIIHGILDWNPKFASQLKVGVDLAGGVANTRVTFFVGGGRYQIALEAILAPEFADEEGIAACNDPWMIKAPVLRTMAQGRPVDREIFSDDAPLNCLLLCGDASGPVDGLTREGKTVSVPELQHIDGECQIIETILKRGPAHGRVGEVRRLGKGGEAKLNIETLSDALRDRVWDVIHFAGHSYYKEYEKGPGCGYLVLGEKGTAHAVEFGDVAAQFRKGKLLYLSSCKSGSAAFAIDAANAGLPRVVGFRTEVKDEFAKRYASNFYTKLLSQNSIERSFLETRKALHSPLDNTWASAMLVMGTAGVS